MRPLAVTTQTARRIAAECAAAGQAGVPGYDASAWQGVIAPAQTPQPIIAKLNTKLNAIVAMDDVRARMADLGMTLPARATPEEMQQFLRSEIVRWRGVVEMAGIAGSEWTAFRLAPGGRIFAKLSLTPGR